MRAFSILISKYVLQAILPYFSLIWLLISVILFVQQASRYSDLLFNTILPSSLVAQLTIALIPSVIAFTCPMAVLVGVIIGLSRMQGDSEMVSLRAAGVGNIQIVTSIVFLGLVLSFFALFINLKGVPFAAQIVRQVALKAALYKLESPIEPGVINSEINNFTIYVDKGNIEKGIWEDIFIYQDDKSNKQVRLITSKEGRIDATEEDSEIVLRNAKVTTFEKVDKSKIVSETVEDFRLTIQTKRGELIEKIATVKETPEEMGLVELAKHIRTLDGIDKTEAHILWQRRILLSITPLIFALLGTALVIKFNRGGKGFGVILSFVSLIIYYLLTLLGEQLARTGSISVITAGVIPLAVSILAIGWLFISRRFVITKNVSLKSLIDWSFKSQGEDRTATKKSFFDLSTRILDFDLIISLLKYYLLTIAFLTTIYLIFTAFELWKFAGTFEGGVQMLLSYLFFLIPFIYIQIAPSALMIAALATYVIKSRQNEVVTWTAAGQSVYRLLLPCFILMIIIGALNFVLQETVITYANQTQDSLRDQIRRRNKILDNDGTFFVTEENKIYKFEKTSASDNDTDSVSNLVVFSFDETNREIKSILKVNNATWANNKIRFLDKAEKTTWDEGEVKVSETMESEFEALKNPFEKEINKTSHLNILETKKKIENAASISERRIYEISLQKKYTTPFLPLIIILFTAPFALTLGRKGNVITIAYAVAVWLVFMGITSVFAQFGQSGFLSPFVSIWSPLILFTIIGLYLLTKVKT